MWEGSGIMRKQTIEIVRMIDHCVWCGKIIPKKKRIEGVMICLSKKCIKEMDILGYRWDWRDIDEKESY